LRIAIIALGVLVVDVIGEGLVVFVGGNRHVVVIVALDQGLVVTIVSNGVLTVVIGNVTILSVLQWVMFLRA
jgi:hypothetical protein